MKIFDTHTHDYFSDFESDRNEMLEEDFLAGVVHKVQIGCDIKTSRDAIALAKKSENMFATVGLHPCNTEEDFEHLSENIAFFSESIEKYNKTKKNTKNKIVGIGETGFDFYHKDTPEMREKQKISLAYHVELSEKYSLPLIIHTRNARNETLQFFAENKSIREKKVSGVIHCFSENAEFAKIITEKYGFYIGIGGVATYPKSEEIREAILHTPIEYIVTETDSPYLAPKSVRGKRNQSKNIHEVIPLIAEIKKMDTKKCADILFENAKRLFSV